VIKTDIEVGKSLIAPKVDGGNHKSIVKITKMSINGGKEVIDVGTHYQILED
jgi:hypothetical protein